MTTRSALAAFAVVTLLTLGTGCAEDVGARVSEEASSSTPSPPVPPVEPTALPSMGGIRVAVPSHCGVLSLTVEGRLWLADPPLGDHNPPPGWDENETTGILLRTGPGRAIFEGDEGQHASFRLADRGATDPNEGCE